MNGYEWFVKYVVNGTKRPGEAVEAVGVNIDRYWTDEMRMSLAKRFLSSKQLLAIAKVEESENE